MALKKSDAVDLLGGNATAAARNLGVDRKTVYNWPEDLPQRVEDQVRGALLRVNEERDRKAVAAFGGAR